MKKKIWIGVIAVLGVFFLFAVGSTASLGSSDEKKVTEVQQEKELLVENDSEDIVGEDIRDTEERAEGTYMYVYMTEPTGLISKSDAVVDVRVGANVLAGKKSEIKTNSGIVTVGESVTDRSTTLNIKDLCYNIYYLGDIAPFTRRNLCLE